MFAQVCLWWRPFSAWLLADCNQLNQVEFLKNQLEMNNLCLSVLFQVVVCPLQEVYLYMIRIDKVNADAGAILD